MREAALYHQDKDRLFCELCEYRCRIAPGHSGACRVRVNEDGKLYTLNYAQVATAQLISVERIPFYHFFPATRSLAVGSWGGNGHSIHGFADPTIPAERLGREVAPDKLVEVAIQQRARGISWVYSEPIIWFEYLLPCVKLAKSRGLFTSVRTNGFLTDDPLDQLGHYLDGWQVEILGLDDHLYRIMRRAPRYQQILAATERAQKQWKVHVEVSTPLYAGVNDDSANLGQIAEWIRIALGKRTPWQLRLAPGRALDADGRDALERAKEMGQAAGLDFIYLDTGDPNVPINTRCPNCHTLVISRQPNDVRANLTLGHCGACDYDINIRNTIFKAEVTAR